MSFEQPKFEKPPENKPEEPGGLEKMETKENSEPVTPEEMAKYQELKKYEFQKLITRGALPEHPERQKIREELKPIEAKAIKEKGRLTGPTFDREDFLTSSEKQKGYIDFLKTWDQLDEKEQFNRLNRVGNELRRMHLSTEEEKSELRDNIALQEKAARSYFKTIEEAKPLSEKDDKKCHDLLEKYISKGLPNLSMGEMRKLSELQDRGQLEAEMLIGPHLADFEILASPSLRKNYLAFLENWNNLDPEERRNRLKRVGDIADRLERERQALVGVGPADPLPRKRIFEKAREEYIRIRKNEKMEDRSPY